MYLASFTYDGSDRVGAQVDSDHLIDFRVAAEATGRPFKYTTMLALILGGDAATQAAADLLRAARDDDKIGRIPMSDIIWHPPVRRPGKILGVALNNSASDARKISAPDHPMFFMKPQTCLLGHKQPIVVRRHYNGLHPEPELAVIIGKLAKDIDPRKGMEYVYGYSILDDVTGNDMRAQDRVHYYALYAKQDNPDEVGKREQHLSYAARYKGADCFGPMGPWLVTKDEVPDPHDLDVICSVDGVVYTQDNTAHYTYRIEEVIAFISRHLTLEPGDVVSMGTAFREGDKTRKPLHTANYARLNGSREISITKLGTLSNPIKHDTSDPGDWRLLR